MDDLGGCSARGRLPPEGTLRDISRLEAGQPASGAGGLAGQGDQRAAIAGSPAVVREGLAAPPPNLFLIRGLFGITQTGIRSRLAVLTHVPIEGEVKCA